MVIPRLLLKGSIEPFDIGIRLGHLKIGMPMGLTEPSSFFIEVFRKLGALSVKTKESGLGKTLLNNLEEFWHNEQAFGAPNQISKSMNLYAASPLLVQCTESSREQPLSLHPLPFF